MVSAVRIIPVSLHLLRWDQNVSPVLPAPGIDLTVDVFDVGRITVGAVATTEARIVRHVPGRVEFFVQRLVLGRVLAMSGAVFRLLCLDRRNGAEESHRAQELAWAVQRTGSRIRPSERRQLSNSALGDLSLEQPPAVTFAACAEAIDALLGAERGTPRIVADQAELAAAHRTAVDRRAAFELRWATRRNYRCIAHCSLPLLLSLLSVRPRMGRKLPRSQLPLEK